jgi:hypothetical protein
MDMAGLSPPQPAKTPLDPGRGVPTVARYVQESARRRGVDPNFGLGIARYEGLNPNTLSAPDYGNPDRGGQAFGPFQLHSKYMGRDFEKKFGEKPSASNWQKQVDFSMDAIAAGKSNRWYAVRDQGGPAAITRKGAEYAKTLDTPTPGSIEVKGNATALPANYQIPARGTPQDLGQTAVRSHGGIDKATDAIMGLSGKHEIVNRNELKDFLKTGGVNLDPQTTAWCAALVTASLQSQGIPGAGNVATSFATWGSPVRGLAQKGDVLVSLRSRFDGQPLTPGQVGGHVGVATGRSRPDGAVEMISGNRGNKVTTEWVDPNTFTARRWDGAAERRQGGKFEGSAGPSTTERVRRASVDDLFRDPSLLGPLGSGDTKRAPYDFDGELSKILQMSQPTKGKQQAQGGGGKKGGGKPPATPKVHDIPGARMPSLIQGNWYVPRPKGIPSTWKT